MIHYTVQTENYRQSFDSPAEAWTIARNLFKDGHAVDVLTYFMGTHTTTNNVSTEDLI